MSSKMTYREWLLLSEDEAIRQRMADDAYSMAYPALLSHFAGIKNLDWDAALLGLHIVYGWMPTIPKLGAIMRWEDAERNKLVAALTKAKYGETPTADELKTIMEFCNNSMIGASKLLHFLNSMAFPIWDSRVAKVFLKNPKAGGQRVNNIEPWITYRTALCAWVDNGEVKEKCEALRALACFLEGVSDLRLVELVMFHKTVSKRKQWNNSFMRLKEPHQG